MIADIEENEPVAEPINIDIDKVLDAMQLEDCESDEARPELHDEKDRTEVTTGNTTQQVPSVQHCINSLKQVKSRFIGFTGEVPDSLVVCRMNLLNLPVT